MTKTLSILATIFLFLTVLIVPNVGQGATGGVVSFIKGNVTQKGLKSSSKRLKLGSKVSEGDVITTGSSSKVVIKLTTGSTLKIVANSKVRLSSLALSNKKTDIYLDRGGVTASVKKLSKGNRFTVRSVTMVAGVRGTVFHVQSDGKTVMVAVQDGEVLLEETETATSQVITPGQMAKAETGKAVANPQLYDKKKLREEFTFEEASDYRKGGDEESWINQKGEPHSLNKMLGEGVISVDGDIGK